jgi:hypothetical protein
VRRSRRSLPPQPDSASPTSWVRTGLPGLTLRISPEKNLSLSRISDNWREPISSVQYIYDSQSILFTAKYVAGNSEATFNRPPAVIRYRLHSVLNFDRPPAHYNGRSDLSARADLMINVKSRSTLLTSLQSSTLIHCVGRMMRRYPDMFSEIPCKLLHGD